ncbi:aldehyde dehydrogenase family protein [Arthrobacter sp. 35W]|uniref:aldehyde dehydrogenase family protein n=1 Tax=Arthrobacter sp. 35W TaxID=1132441 RepID=UPI000688E0CD|nr:aldehyde dehydrogenase family protein [Arthrobacter sp. 35W]
MTATFAPRGSWTPVAFDSTLQPFLSASADALATFDPATGGLVARVATSTLGQVDEAVDSAERAFRKSSWRNDGALRARVLFRWAERMRQQTEQLAELLTREQGKTLGQARGEVLSSISMIEFNAGQARAIYGRSAALKDGVHGVVLREPVGIVAAITPWNYPLNLTIRAVAPALAAGNAVIVKPASLTPAIVIAALALLAQDDDLPDGIVRAVVGSGATVGDRLVTHDGVNMIAFTGDSATGINVMKRGADSLKKVSLELGGKSPNIVFADANLDKALIGAENAIFSSAGQICTAGSRLLLEESIHDEFVERLAARARGMHVGDGLDPATQMGPLVSAGHKQTVWDYVEVANAEGTVVAGGRALEGGPYDDGHFVAPTIVTDLPAGSRLLKEEVFGPVLAVQKFGTEEEAIQIANGTEFGLACGLWTSDLDRSWRVGRAVDAGTIWINTYHHFYGEMEVGGFKKSGIGRQQGIEGLLEFTETKHLNFDSNPTFW